MTYREVVRDADGEVVAAMCVARPFTEEERVTMLEFFTWVRDRVPQVSDEQVARQQASIERIRTRAARLSGATS